MGDTVLVRVTGGVYRTMSGAVRVFKREWQDRERPWVACYTSLFGARVEKRFRTLAEVRAELHGGTL